MHPQAIKVQNALLSAGCQSQVRELPDSTRTAVEAAQACGCGVGQIVKSLIFILEPTGEPILVLVSGSNRVQEAGLGARMGGKLLKATADLVQQATGFVIGGVPPLGHASALPTYLDVDLLQYDVVWAAAGTPHAVFPVGPDELRRITGAKVVTVK
jgi:prolyl-tRNA editing enzyme YbaK/EbsC (Cys-tRNA(Pro) deacylase)